MVRRGYSPAQAAPAIFGSMDFVADPGNLYPANAANSLSFHSLIGGGATAVIDDLQATIAWNQVLDDVSNPRLLRRTSSRPGPLRSPISPSSRSAPGSAMSSCASKEGAPAAPDDGRSTMEGGAGSGPPFSCPTLSPSAAGDRDVTKSFRAGVDFLCGHRRRSVSARARPR